MNDEHDVFEDNLLNRFAFARDFNCQNYAHIKARW